MRLQWTENAYDDLFRIADFLDDEFAGSSPKMLEGILGATDLLVQHSQIGPTVMGSRIRKWPVADSPYLLLYQASNGLISILRVVHNRSDWQSLL